MVALLLSWGSGLPGGCEVGINGEPQLSTPDIQTVALGCKGSKLGFWIWGETRPGQAEGGRVETMLRRFAAGLWGLCG